MQLDPNWFYSSLAQSAASVVGLLGGVLATRLQQQIVEVRELRLQAEQHLQQLAREYSTVVTPLRVYTTWSASQVAALEERLSSAENSFSYPVWYAPFEKSEPASVGLSEHMLAIERARHCAAADLLPVLEQFAAANSVAALRVLTEGLGVLGTKMPDDMSARVRPLRDLAQSAAHENELLALRARTRMGWVLWLCLVGICAVGVIWPLSYLSAYEPIHRGLMLGGFAVCLAVLLGYILIQLKELIQLPQVGSILSNVDTRARAA